MFKSMEGYKLKFQLIIMIIINYRALTKHKLMCGYYVSLDPTYWIK